MTAMLLQINMQTRRRRKSFQVFGRYNRIISRLNNMRWYIQMLEYITGVRQLDETRGAIVRATAVYARRQR